MIITMCLLLWSENKIEGLLPLFWGSSPSHSLQHILQPFKKEGVIFCKPFEMNLYYSFQHRLNDKHGNVHFQQKLQYIHEGQFLR